MKLRNQNFKKTIWKLATSFMNSFGYDIYLSKLHQSPDMDSALRRSRKRGLTVRTVIDIGASNGSWSALCMKYYPDAFYYLIEAQLAHQPALVEFGKIHRNSNFVLAAAGNRVGEIFFSAEDLFGGLAAEEPMSGNCIKAPVTTVDYEVKKHKLEAPYLIKLDTHGFEVPILEGAERALGYANLVIIESYNFRLTRSSLKFYEMCRYMEQKGFYPIDIADPLYRPFDRSFWQMDIFFIRSDRKEFDYTCYQ